mmetsp:Transcript_59033/g.129403  ORF Transcript_59033/g.129403 Transcript_59033/m.129403 type:complete len:262 (+) Transcript_59033:1030-1815(+)
MCPSHQFPASLATSAVPSAAPRSAASRCAPPRPLRCLAHPCHHFQPPVAVSKMHQLLATPGSNPSPSVAGGASRSPPRSGTAWCWPVCILQTFHPTTRPGSTRSPPTLARIARSEQSACPDVRSLGAHLALRPAGTSTPRFWRHGFQLSLPRSSWSPTASPWLRWAPTRHFPPSAPPSPRRGPWLRAPRPSAPAPRRRGERRAHDRRAGRSPHRDSCLPQAPVAPFDDDEDPLPTVARPRLQPDLQAPRHSAPAGLPLPKP